MIKPRYISKVSVTRPDNTTPYAALDVLGTDPASVIEFTNIAPQGGGTIVLLYASLMINVGSGGPSQTRLHLYSSAPTAIADNAAFNLPSGDRAKYLGYVTLPAPTDLGDTMFAEDDFLRKTITTTSSSVFAVAETSAVFTPAAVTVKTWELRSVEA
jgi:hypothetical protein